MINCTPESVSTDYDTSDRLFFEPVTLEDVLEIVRLEKPKGVIVQYGGQTPLKLARALQAAGVPIIGTSPDAIDQAEDRERFQQMVQKLGLLQPANRTARSVEDGVRHAEEIGYPRSEEHTSELQSLMRISSAAFCLKKKKKPI